MSKETTTGLDPWTRADLPEAPAPQGLQWLGVVGPGVIVLGLSIGGGEFLLGPAAFVRYGLSLLWITLVSVFFQTVFNTELMRYAVATGEPVFTGFMRTRPSRAFWAWFYAGMYFLQTGWPYAAGLSAGAIFFLATGRIAAPADAASIYNIGAATFLICIALLLVGRRIEHTLELLNWVMVVCILGGFLILSLVFVPGGTWLGAAVGLIGFDRVAGGFNFLPSGADFQLLAALAGYSGAGGMVNMALSSWARDKGYGMGERVGYIPAAVGGHKVKLAHAGFIFQPDEENMRRWRGWWRIVRADQWGIFFSGALFGMVLPAVLYVTLLPVGSNIQGLGISAALASSIGTRSGAVLGGIVAALGAWILFKTQLDIVEGMVRSLTDILWTGSKRVRTLSRGDVRVVYYCALGVICLWGIVALRLAQPIVLIMLAANVAATVFTVSSLHLLYVNTHLLPRELHPALWRRIALVAMACFYGLFAAFSLSTLF
ncbi:MAG TPA: Nramp family divalent metal transporter [Vicinamibacterales bacterium]|nr:Nramp family divalent metal transporter [Vicinamibacterales bacterium]